MGGDAPSASAAGGAMVPGEVTRVTWLGDIAGRHGRAAAVARRPAPEVASARMSVWHVTLNGRPACTAIGLAEDERLEPPICGSRNRLRVDEYAAMLRERHPEVDVQVVEHGCPMRGE